MAVPALAAVNIVGYRLVPPDQLLAHPQNPRRHPNAQREALRASLRALGWIAPVVQNLRTGHLLDGHARVEEALSAGVEAVPVIDVELTPEQETLALATFDPITAMAALDRETLDSLLHDVATDEAALQTLLADVAKEAGLAYGTADDLVDVPPQLDRAAELQALWGTERGQLWVIPSATVPGQAHRLLCGDATDAGDVARLMDGRRAASVLTDPPYGMDLDTDWSGVVGSAGSIGRAHQIHGQQHDRVVGDAVPFDPAGLFEYWGYCREMFLWGADYYAERIPDRTQGSWLVWDKRKDSQADAIGSEFELCWSKAAHKRRMLRHDWFGFLSSENGSEARQRVHPTQKPTSLMRDILQQWTDAAAVVADPYLGAAAVMLAAEQTGRVCYGLEIEPKYVAVALQRLADLGLAPERADG